VNRRWISVLVLAAGLLAAPALAHPGSGIVVDRQGQVYFVDMVSGVWKLDPRGALAQIPGPAFHWMALDAGDRFATARLPSGTNGDFARLGSKPTLILASDFPIAVGRDGNLYYPSHARGRPVRIFRYTPSGESSTVATLPATTARGPLLYLNGIAAGPDGSVYSTENDTIRRVGGDGQLSTIVENIASLACGSAPKKRAKDDPMLQGLDIAADGTIYVAATGCRSVLKVTPDGHVTILPQVPDAWAPTGVALSGDDLYVLEFQNADTEDRRKMLPRVRKIAADGTTKIVATVTRK
jgi:sugar lactone lactonase YvrE